MVSTTEDHRRVAEAIQQIESDLAVRQPAELQAFDVTVDDPDRLMSMLRKEFAATQMMLSEDKKKLLAWVRADQLEDVQKKVEELTVILPAKRESEWRPYATEAMELADMQALLKPVVRSAQFKPEPQRKRLMVWATPEEHTKIASTLSAFQGEDATEYEDVLLGYPLNRGDPASVVSMLQQMRPDVKFAADERANRILVTAPLEEQARIRAIIDQLDTGPNEPAGDVAKSYDIKTVTPSTIISLLQPTVPKLRMTANDSRGTLAVVGSSFDHQKLAKTIEQLDTEGQQGKVISYNVGNTEPYQVRSVLQQLVPGIVVSVNEDTRSVIVWGKEADHEKVRQAVEQFTAEGASKRTTEIYRFDRTNNRSVEAVFERLAPRARVSPIYGTNAVIATATADEHAMFREAADKLNGGDEQSVTRVYAIDKKQINVDDVLASIDDSLKSRLAMRMNEQTNSLMVRGSEEDQERIRQLIDEIGKQIPPRQQRVPKVYELIHADPDTAEFILRDLYPDSRITEDDNTGTIAATATPEDHVGIASVLKELDVPGQQSQRVTEIYRFDRVNGRAAENAFERIAPRARVSFVYGTNSVIATATEAEHKLFREAASKMNGGDNAQSITRVYAIDKKRINVDDVLASIDDTLRARLALRMNEQTNSLMVRGSPEDQEQVRQLIEEISTQIPPREQRTPKVYTLRYADPDSAASVLRDLYPDSRFTDDRDTGTIAATALEEDHVGIAKIIADLDIPGQQSQQITEIYRFDRVDGGAVEDAFRRIAPRSRVSRVYGTSSVIATATEAEHKQFREAADKMNGEGQESVTRVYPLDKKQIDVEDVLASIDDTLRSRLALRMNEQTNSLMVRGTLEDQQTMKELIEQIIEQVPPRKQDVVQVYKLKYGSARAARYALREMFDDAMIAADDDTETLIATADAEDQQRIGQIVEQLDQPRESLKTTRIYRLDSARASRVYLAIRELVDDGRVTYDNESNTVIVTATDVLHKSVDEVIEDLNNGQDNDIVPRVYELKTADSNNIRSSLERLMPRLKVASDNASQSLIVSASEEDQLRVAALVKQLDEMPGQEAAMQAYVVRSADPQQVFQSLSTTFAGNGNFSLSFQEATKTIFVVATPKNQKIFEGLMQKLDTPELADTGRIAKTYPLPNLSPNAGRAAITALLKGTVPAPTVELDDIGNALIVVASPDQHAKVENTLGSLSGAETDLEVFELDYVDPWTVESAVDSLYLNQPANASPTVTSDYFSQRIFVRGTTDQIEEIRKLLMKMGETSVAPRTVGGGGDVRTIPIRGDVRAAVEQLQQLWPQLRSNRIQVVAPSAPAVRSSLLPAPLEAIPTAPPPAVDPPSTEVEKDRSASVERPSARTSHLESPTRYVALQTTTRAPEAANESQPSPSDESVADEEEASEQTGDAPVVIIPEDDSITIASSDQEALNQLEELLRLLSRSESDTTSRPGSDFAVFLLRNTGASDMRQLLGELFEQLRKNDRAASGTGRGSGGGGFGMSPGFGSNFSSLFGPNFGNVAVVADDRLNALIIHGDRQERELIEELLRVLDTKDLPNPIVVYQPELIRLENTQAERVLAILRNVYTSQLKSGGGRKKVDIPEGVDPEVASVLQQINATSGAPILTLDVDDTTNSIVMRAPPELRQEITAFVRKLDHGAGANRSRNVRVIPIRRGKSDQIREAIQQFILDRSR